MEDAQAAIDAGADALGFMFYEPSKRFITPDDAAKIIEHVPDDIDTVGVFVNADEQVIRSTVKASGVNAVQFHGEEFPEFCEQFRPLKIWKAFRIESERSLQVVRKFPNADAWLLDSYVKGSHGGTGHTFNWDLAVDAKDGGQPIILAGGLTADNIGDAVAKVRPFGVDVSSGVESSPGIKDAHMIQAFVKNAKGA